MFFPKKHANLSHPMWSCYVLTTFFYEKEKKCLNEITIINTVLINTTNSYHVLLNYSLCHCISPRWRRTNTEEH